VLLPPARPQEQSQIVPPELPPGTSEAAKPKPVKVPEIVVKDLRKRDDTTSYVADEARSATKTDTPLIEVPQSISVITRKQLTDRNVQTLDEAVRYSAGVQADTFGSNLLNNDILIRGFRVSPNGIFRDGLQMSGASGFSPWRLEPYGAKRIEVLRGPASVNYGMVPAGGLINFETKRPTDTPLHEIWLQAGNFNRYQGNFDLSDRIDEKGNWLFRLTGLLRESDTQTDFVKNNRIYIAPAVTWTPRHDTSITFLGFYQKDVVGQIQGYLPASGTLFTNPNGRIPRNRFGGEPSFMTDDLTQYSFGYLLEHRLNDVWTFRQNLRYNNLSGETRGVIGGGLDPADPSQRTLLRSSYHFTNNTSSFQVDSHAQAKFATGPVAQTMLFGVDYLKFTFKNPGSFGGASSINIFNPSHAPPFAQILSPFADSTDPTTKVDQIGLYVQDQMKFYDRLVLTLSGRQDFYTSSTVDATFNTRANENQGRFSGRAGLTYVSSIGIAPYVAYATSFEPLRSTNFFGQPFKPIVGKLIEGGVKYMPPSKDFSLTAAVFELSQENALTPDPANPLNSLQVGEIRHRGFELEGTASLAAGLNMIAAYTYLDPKITQSNAGDQGNRTPQVPINQATAFGKYTVQSGPLAGFGFGPGVRYIGSTFGDTANTVKLPSYVLIDAMADYSWGNYQLAVNASNLFDKTFVASCFSTDACFYGNARVVIATLRYRW
jgi:iron complex outermembrane receptor protein